MVSNIANKSLSKNYSCDKSSMDEEYSAQARDAKEAGHPVINHIYTSQQSPEDCRLQY